IIARYLLKLKCCLRNRGFDGDIILFQSNGGVVRSEFAIQKPVYVATSGPAAGVVASRFLAQLYGLEKVLSFDMGGTTTKASIVINKEYLITTEYQFEWDIPIAVPMIEMSEVGTGGGSIAWIDKGGMLRVGPMSAGSMPGPACYDRGGMEPTIVDANVVLHRLNPNAILGKRIKINKEKAVKTIKEKICDMLGLDLIDAAIGILKIANINMAEACRNVTLRKGYDPREFTMIAFGGAGPMHVCDIIRELGIKKIIVPWFPGVFSALGMCISDLIHERVLSVLKTLDEIETTNFNNILINEENNIKSELQAEGVKEDNIKIIRYGRIRYIGEAIGKELTIQIPPGEVTVESLKYVREHFERIHNEMYGFTVPREPVILTDVIIRGVGLTEKIKLKKYPLTSELPPTAIIEERDVYFEEIGDFLRVKVYQRENLKPGNLIEGPAIIEEATATIVLKPYYNAYIDEYRNIIISLQE
ncbi:MAG: hydantoinase/oxoprolinase family protein, partial [Ignisphaera sp.]